MAGDAPCPALPARAHGMAAPRRVALLLAGLLAAPLPGAAQGLVSERSVSAALADEAVAAAIEACAGRGHRVTAAVVDRSGMLRALLRADGAGPHTIAAARDKAYTAASMRANTTQVLEMVRTNPAASRLPDMAGVLIVGGGIPIRVGEDVVGAIGVDGAPGGHLDDQCAEAGIARIRDRLN